MIWYKISVGKPKGKHTLRRPGHEWDNTIKMDLEEIWLDGMGPFSSGYKPVMGSHDPLGSI
jgi:hypothetical protein